jgi:hypothetical protein
VRAPEDTAPTLLGQCGTDGDRKATVGAKENGQVRYDSFRLQVWRSIRLDRVQWSARLEELKDGRHTQFTSLDALVAHLLVRLDPEAIADLSAPAPVDGGIA